MFKVSTFVSIVPYSIENLQQEKKVEKNEKKKQKKTFPIFMLTP